MTLRIAIGLHFLGILAIGFRPAQSVHADDAAVALQPAASQGFSDGALLDSEAFLGSEALVEGAESFYDADMFQRPAAVSSPGPPMIAASFARPPVREYIFLPDGLLWHSYLAGPHEPRMSSVIFANTDEGILWDATLGGRVGLYRYGTYGSRAPQGWQLDFEGAVMTRLDLMHSEDVESADYRFGMQVTTAEGPWSTKFGYFHISSHVGDEYMERHPLFQRTNYVTESLVGGLSYQATEAIRLYGESAWAFSRSGGARPWQFQGGIEHVPVVVVPNRGGPFSAVNLDIRQAVRFDPTLTVQTGWQWQGFESGRRLRVGVQYSRGPTSQFSFFRRKEESLGVGVWLDH